MNFTRREFLKWSSGALATLIAACTGRLRPDLEENPAELLDAGAPTILRPPGPFGPLTDGMLAVEAIEGQVHVLAWTSAEWAEAYDVELNGALLSEGLEQLALEVGFGERRLGYQEGANTWRVRAHNRVGERWSEAGRFEVRPVGGVRSRRFDLEDDGDIQLTVGSASSALTVGAQYAYGAGGKGVALRCFDPSNTRAYKNLHQVPVAECWVRLAVRPELWELEDVEINLARIRSSETQATERLKWRTGRGVNSTSVAASVPTPGGLWSQVQIGVLEDGSVELWAFDGRREYLIGTGRNRALAGRVKDMTSIGNDAADRDITFEIWLDEFAVGEARLPWARADDRHEMARPIRIEPEALPEIFSFTFGSCNVSSRVPFRNTALEAAAAAEPDFFIHLGDLGYPDSGAYSQTDGGYLAFWTDLLQDEQLSRLARVPWIFTASDHDLGGNNVDAASISPFALEAFRKWQSNPPEADGIGHYGSLSLDGGRVLLIWLEGIALRSPLDSPDGPGKTVLGPEQKRWFLDLLAGTQADLIIIASQTSIGHEVSTAWASYPREREEVLESCRRTDAHVRWITGDHHSARWADLGGRVAEWGAAPFCEVPQVCSPPAPGVEAEVCISRLPLRTAGEPPTPRNEVLESFTLEELNAQTSFGRVVVDTRARTATFEVRDNAGSVRVHDSGFRMQETITYG